MFLLEKRIKRNGLLFVWNMRRLEVLALEV